MAQITIFDTENHQYHKQLMAQLTIEGADKHWWRSKFIIGK
jgi:hypothetical protein